MESTIETILNNSVYELMTTVLAVILDITFVSRRLSVTMYERVLLLVKSTQ
jgi:hypothetical protein